jgi:2-dehydropantoate 2-reductase
LIVGTGALACLFAARFSAAAIPVTVLGSWPEGVAALRDNGVTLGDVNGGERNYPVRVVTAPEECERVKLALVLVKSWQTERAARQLWACLHPQGMVLSLQNGLGNRQKLVQSLGEARVALGVTTTGATLIAPGRVRPGGEGRISLVAGPLLQPFVDRFQRAGFGVDETPELAPLIWGKLAVNAAINPLTAILRVPNGELLAQQSTRQLMALAAREVEAVARAQGIWLPFDDVAAAVETVTRRTAPNHSSMFQDVLRGAPTEIEAINGAILKFGAQTDVPTRVNQTLYLLVKSMVSKNSSSGKN